MTTVFVSIGLGLLALVVLAVVAFGLLWWGTRGLREGFELGPLFQDFALAAQTRPGTMPRSLQFSGVVYRYQGREHVHQGDEIWKMFEDGPWKWEAKQRFAGRNINPGHFLAFELESARQEMLHYVSEAQIGKYVALSLELALDNVADFTDMGTVQLAVRAAQAEGTNTGVLNEMVTTETGGGRFTDFMGYWAHRAGYDAALFFSARRLTPDEREAINPNRRWDDRFAYLEYDDLRGQIGKLCLVVFSGPKLLSAVTRCGVDAAPSVANPYAGKPERELWPLFRFGEDYQLDQGSLIFVPHSDD